MNRRFVKSKKKKSRTPSKIDWLKAKGKKYGWVFGTIGFCLTIVGLFGVPYIRDNYLEKLTITPNRIELWGSQYETITTFSISNNSRQMLYSVEIPIELLNCTSAFGDFSVEPVNPNSSLAVTIGGESGGIVWDYNYFVLGGETVDGVPYLQLHINSFPPNTSELFKIKFGKGAQSINGQKVVASMSISSFSSKPSPIFGQ